MKTKSITLILAALGLIAAGCSIKENRSKCLAPVNVHLSGFTVSLEDFPDTRTTVDAVDYSDINAVTLAFYTSGGAQQYKHTQIRTDGSTFTIFGDFSLSLPMGSYTMVAIAHTTKEGNTFSLTSPTAASYTGTHAYDTFVFTDDVDITNADDAVDISATLERVVTSLKVISTDGKTANATNVKMHFSAGGRSFNPTTGLATVNTGFDNTVSISAAVGSPSTSQSMFFLTADEQTMDVTIETLDGEGNTLSTNVVNDVPFKRNRITKLTGSIYTNNGVGGSFQLTTDWLTDYNDTF